MPTDISVVLLTYNRPEYAETTLRSTLDNLDCGGRVHVHVADDGTSLAYRERLCMVASECGASEVTVSDAERGGYGKNYNLAMQVAHQMSPVVLPLEDDWKLTRTLHVEPLVLAMRELSIGCLRLGYVGYTQTLRVLFEYSQAVRMHFLRFEPDSTEQHVFAGHPRLEMVDWARQVGPWPEGLNPGETEFEVAHRPQSRVGVAWPVDYIHPRGDLFAHIGTVRSY